MMTIAEQDATRNKPLEDEIVAEVHAVREALGAEYGYDFDRIYQHIKTFEIERRRTLGDVIGSQPARRVG